LSDFAGQKKKPALSEVKAAAGDDEGGAGWRLSFSAGTCAKADEAAALLASVSIRQHTSAYVSIRQHTSAYLRIRQHTSTYPYPLDLLYKYIYVYACMYKYIICMFVYIYV
jgi:hypothetical protein